MGQLCPCLSALLPHAGVCQQADFLLYRSVVIGYLRLAEALCRTSLYLRDE